MGRAGGIRERLARGEVLLSDGAWGTELYRRGLAVGRSPEEWNLQHPEVILELAREYFEAGAVLGQTNTFGGTKFRLMKEGLGGQVRELNLAGARLSRQAATPFGALVLGTVGPTGELVEPLGLVSKEEIQDAFRIQIGALREGGVDGVLLETFSALEEIEQAVRVAQEAGLFCAATMTFLRQDHGGYRTLYGVSPETAAAFLEKLGVDVIGTNCGHGLEEMILITRQLRACTAKPLMIQSNAGLPRIQDGVAVYEESPEWMAGRLEELLAAGAAIVGGCCGTTPEHIRRFRRVLDQRCGKTSP